MNKIISKLFSKNNFYSKPSVVLVSVWSIILIWYFLTGFSFLEQYPLQDYYAIPILALVSAYYFGKYNFTEFSKKAETQTKEYIDELKN